MTNPFDLTKVEEDLILTNSIERVINTTRSILLKARATEDVCINTADWEDLKWLVCKLWDRERNTIFTRRLEAAKTKGATNG